MGWIKDFFRQRKSDRLGDIANRLKYDRKFAEAAKAYAAQADFDLPDNELIFSTECRYAFEMWMKAGDAANALAQARRALHGYTLGDWLKGNHNYIDNLTQMVVALRRADHLDEADSLLLDINDYLTSIGELPAVVAEFGNEPRFPAECPSCGGSIKYRGSRAVTTCPYCSGAVNAL
ncbi:MAG: hypothetical protein ACRERV_14150 [Methylococcales bacterium]